MTMLYKNFSINKKSTIWLIIFMLLFIGTLVVIHDIIITKILALYICRSDTNPKYYIKRSINYPESVYWEDNVYPGFDANDRLLMIRNYLDGIHLKKMALNAPDGRIYVFTANRDDWQKSRKFKKEKPNDWKEYFNIIEKESKAIESRRQIYTKQSLPKVNYSVIFNLVPLTRFQRRYLYSDEIKIIKNATREVIGYNKRLMHLWYFIKPDAVGGRYYYPEAICGRNGYLLEASIFLFAKNFHNQLETHRIGLNHLLYKKLYASGKLGSI